MEPWNPQQVQLTGYRDSLTRVWTRQVFRAALDEALAREAAPTGTIAVFLVSLRDFRTFNSDQGFEAGDAALQVVAGRLADAVGSDGFVARVGGDQFAVVLEPVSGTREAAQAAALLLGAVELPLASSELRTSQQHLRGLALTASVGGAVSAAGLTTADLWRRADEATYPAERERGRGVHGPGSFVYGEGDARG